MTRCALRVAILYLLATASSFVVAEDKQAEKANDQPVAATVKVQGAPPIPIGTGFKWKNIPDFLTDAIIYEKPLPKPVQKLEFEVQKDGVVLMAASWSYDGNEGGGWKETRWTDKMLADDGWIAIGQMDRFAKDNKADPHVVYRRLVKAGERFQIHTRKYNTPHLILPSANRVNDALAAKPVGGRAVATAPSTTASPRRDRLMEFQDLSDAGAALVGLRVTIDSHEPIRKFGSIQPIYETTNGRRIGQVHGVATGNVVEVQAKPGYAIGGLTLSMGESLAGFRVKFLRRTASGFDEDDSYSSRWIGDQIGDSVTRVTPGEHPFVGIRGTIGDAIRTMEMISPTP